eukprot:3007584-Rhodomonas_salina.2
MPALGRVSFEEGVGSDDILEPLLDLSRGSCRGWGKGLTLGSPEPGWVLQPAKKRLRYCACWYHPTRTSVLGCAHRARSSQQTQYRASDRTRVGDSGVSTGFRIPQS